MNPIWLQLSLNSIRIGLTWISDLNIQPNLFIFSFFFNKEPNKLSLSKFKNYIKIWSDKYGSTKFKLYKFSNYSFINKFGSIPIEYEFYPIHWNGSIKEIQYKTQQIQFWVVDISLFSTIEKTICESFTINRLLSASLISIFNDFLAF